MGTDRPNILFIFADQLRADALGCTGAWVETPNIDAIAAEGTLFSSCYTNSPVCVPARLSLATGRYPHNTNVWKNCPHTMPEETATWMQAIRREGYRTSLFGKTHLHPHSGDLRDREYLLHAYGMDDVDEIGGPRASRNLLSHMTARWQSLGLWETYRKDYDERFGNKPWVARPSPLPLEEYADIYVGQRAKEYLEKYRRPEPWFCWVSFGGPHEPWDAPEPYAGQYSPVSMPDPISPSPPERAIGPGGRTGRLQHLLETHPASGNLTKEEIAAMRANYAGSVTLIDDQIGEIVQTVKKRGEWDNTVVLLSSDHGEMNGDFGLIYKENFLDSAARIPMIARIPGGIGGAVHEGSVELMDAGPTLAELAGAEMEHRQFGISLVPVLVDESAAHRDSALSEIHGETMLVNGKWKAVINDRGEIYMLFDREADPAEISNLAGHPDLASIEDSLRLRMLERIASSHLSC